MSVDGSNASSRDGSDSTVREAIVTIKFSFSPGGGG